MDETVLATYTEYNKRSATLYVAFVSKPGTYIVKAYTSNSFYLISTLIQTAMNEGVYINKEQANYLFTKIASKYSYGEAN